MRSGARRGPLGGVIPPHHGTRAAGESRTGTMVLLGLLALVAFAATYSIMSALQPPASPAVDEAGSSETSDHGSESEPSSKEVVPSSSMCRGMEHMELWGEVDKWGTNNLVNTAEDCCKQCQERCKSKEACTCNSWVWCGDKQNCGNNFGQCWLKRQEDVLRPDVHGMSTDVPWTSGFVHAPGTGIIVVSTDLGSIRIRLEPTWAPQTVNYIRELLHMKYCTGCQFYRAEGLGQGWNGDGTRTTKPPGPPYALVQGTLQTDGLPFKPLPREATPVVKRGFVCLIGDGPDFFISLGDHTEWGNAHTVFGRVVDEDMDAVVGKFLQQETKQETWGETKVLALAKPIEFKIEKDASGVVF